MSIPDAVAVIERRLPSCRVPRGVPVVPSRRARAPRRGRRAGPRAPSGPRRDVSTCCSRFCLIPAPAAGALPADLRHGDGQGRGGSFVLPLVAAQLAQRGRRRPDGLLHDHRRVPRREATRQRDPAALDDHPLDARHQTRRGRSGADHALAEVPDAWSDGPRGFLHLVPRPDPGFGNLLWLAIVVAWPVTGLDADWRERLHGYAVKAEAEAGYRTSGPPRTRTTRRPSMSLVDTAIDRPEVRTVVEEVLDMVAGRRLDELAHCQGGRDSDARRPRLLPGQRAVGDVARRSRQPPPGRLRRYAARCSTRSPRRAPVPHRRGRPPRRAKLLVSRGPSGPPRADRPLRRSIGLAATGRGRRSPASPSIAAAPSPWRPDSRWARRPRRLGRTRRSRCPPVSVPTRFTGQVLPGTWSDRSCWRCCPVALLTLSAAPWTWCVAVFDVWAPRARRSGSWWATNACR